MAQGHGLCYDRPMPDSDLSMLIEIITAELREVAASTAGSEDPAAVIGELLFVLSWYEQFGPTMVGGADGLGEQPD
jgi:hypothetical protein